MSDTSDMRSRDQARLDALTATWLAAADKLRQFIETNSTTTDAVARFDIPRQLQDQFGLLLAEEHKAEEAFVAEARRFLGRERGGHGLPRR